MSILIKGMKMPKNCPQCPCAYWADHSTFLGCNVKPGKRYAMKDEEYRKLSTRPNWCPLVEVPTPHGRLIDAKTIERVVYKTGDRVYDFDPKTEETSISYQSFLENFVYDEGITVDAPTVIEAEE